MSIRRARMNGSAPLRTTFKRKMRIHIDHLRVLSWNADEVTGDRSHDNAISLTRRIYGKHTLSQRRSADPTEVVAPLVHFLCRPYARQDLAGVRPRGHRVRVTGE